MHNAHALVSYIYQAMIITCSNSAVVCNFDLQSGRTQFKQTDKVVEL